MDSDRLLEFLSRPRTMEEIAKHFRISQSEVEPLLMKEVQSGAILVTRLPKQEPDQARPSNKKILPRSMNLQVGRARLPRTRATTVPSETNLNKYKLAFKFQGSRPVLLQRNLSPPATLGLLGRKHVAKPGRSSFLMRLLVLESLNLGPRKLDDLRAALGVSRNAVEGLVKKRFLTCNWGPKGVGNFYKITERGLEELQCLKAASTISTTIVKKGLVSARSTGPLRT